MTIEPDADELAELSSSRGRWLAWAAALAFVSVCLWPHLGRLWHPSLYADDVVRIEHLQTKPLGALLFEPFNEHMAPLFQCVSWLAWQAAGRRLAWAPAAFTVASFIPFLIILWVLSNVLNQETKSATASSCGVSLFSLSWLAVETVHWYSASSFMWAALLVLGAWAGASATGRRGLAGLAASVAASACAPAFCGIGLLAGPLGCLRRLSANGARGHSAPRRWAEGLVPMLGTLVYLGICSLFHYREILGANLERRGSAWPALLATLQAPAIALAPSLVGLRGLPSGGILAACVTVAGCLAFLALARRSPMRALLLGGLACVIGGYALTFAARAAEFGPRVFQVQRYHLLPLIGMTFLTAPVFKQFLGRFDARPLASLQASTVVAMAFMWLNGHELRMRERSLRFPDQAATLAAMDQVAELCRERGLSREQAIRGLDPIGNAWTPVGYNALIMLPVIAGPAEVVREPGEIRAEILSALTPSERQALCGGMEATAYLARLEGAEEEAGVGRVAKLYRIHPRAAGAKTELESEGWPSFVEYEFPDVTSAPVASLSLGGRWPGDLVEVWWRGGRQGWSESRSVRFRPPDEPGWALRVGRLPHWDFHAPGRLRVMVRGEGPIAAAAPRLLR